jgi:hypothetical protein
MPSTENPLSRRSFLKTAGSVSTLAAGAGAAGNAVSIVADPADPVAGSAPGRWAVKHLSDTLTARGVAVRGFERIAEVPAAGLCIVASGPNGAIAAEGLRSAGVQLPAAPEALVLAQIKASGKAVLLAAGRDARGLVYALLELADRAEHASDPLAALAVATPIAEQPANRVRSVARLFTSEPEDKPWYNDREMWPRYLNMLAAQRYNRFHLAFGIGYDFLRDVTDAYFLFTYPFLVSVPGFDVRAGRLSDAERERNLEMLRFISEQTVARGLEFQLGLWMHGYEWSNSPKASHYITGLTAANHGAYCRAAVATLLKACPAITGVTFRVHGESGVEEGSYDFWKTVFAGVVDSGRKIEIDMHAKGMDQTMMDIAVASGMPVKISPKYWAEHLGMPYHQADIREQERPRPGRTATGLMALSAGSRSFLRYGYGDLLRENRKWGVLHRIWPGTQRLLVWGDPVTAAAHSRNFGFCGSDGVDIMEPLSFKGRRGSGIAGDRCAYADTSLRPHWDWEKYAYGHRVWGRLLYNPDAAPEVWQRFMQRKFGPAAPAMEAALSNASRILPIVTTAHAPSAGNNTYWPEVYLNHSLVDASRSGPYSDSPAPRVFGNVSPLDPQLFTRINDFADELLGGERSAKYTPLEVAAWIEGYAAVAAKQLAAAQAQSASRTDADFRRFTIDIAIASDLGRFFAAKFRSGVLYRIFEKTGDRAALDHSLRLYRSARATWAGLADRARPVYLPDITVGETPVLRGHWLDRLPDMDTDIAVLAQKLEALPAGASGERAAPAVEQVLATPSRPVLSCRHAPPPRFRTGQPLELALSTQQSPASVRLYYRHVTQAERYVEVAMQKAGSTYTAAIPAAYTKTEYPIQYYFEVRFNAASASLYPGFKPDLTGQPYFVVRA